MATTLDFTSQDSVNDYISDIVDQETKNNSNGTLKSVIDFLERNTIKVTESSLKAKDAMKTCPICMEDFELNQKLVRLHCGHLFHDHCVLPWLKEKSTCPMCRYQLRRKPQYREVLLPDGYTVVIFKSSGGILTVRARYMGTIIRLSIEDWSLSSSRSRLYA